ncbi:hypothetical protein K2173_005421 [Erythroxylum novogranatense]|uniref:RING-CH-type domain-containing protein n=1 Tax=Erythroxylum novogranatense TaxID=1862640 RepID=A0AAV8T6Y6_9ROSI|nr:hypothetical protein K2173_005421 [Erythroxylum novogranatense]
MGRFTDEETGQNKGVRSSLAQINQDKSENVGRNFSISDDGVVPETVAVSKSGEAWSGKSENGLLKSNNSGLGSIYAVKTEEISGGRGTAQLSNEGTSRNSDDYANGTGLEAVVIVDSGEITSVRDSKERKELGDNSDEVICTCRQIEQKETGGKQRGKTIEQIEQGFDGNLSTLVDGVVPETVISIDSAENAAISDRHLEIKDNVFGSSKVTVDNSKANSLKVDKPLCVIDMKSGSVVRRGSPKDNPGGETVCRICHLDSELAVETGAANIAASFMDLIQLGCGCKDELGIAHAHCAEAWFKLKGNRICEICGEMATNITGEGDGRFLEEWNHRRFMGNGNLPDQGGGCWRGQPFCNFLMACLIIGFVLPWFFRVNMF